MGKYEMVMAQKVRNKSRVLLKPEFTIQFEFTEVC